MSDVTREEVMQYPPREALKKYPWGLLEKLFVPKSIAHLLLRYDVEKYNLEFRSDLIACRVPEHLMEYYVYVLKYDVPAERFYRLLRNAHNDPLTHPAPRHTRMAIPKQGKRKTKRPIK